MTWTQWYQHDGTGCPGWVVGKLVQTVTEGISGRIYEREVLVERGDGRSWDWKYFGAPATRGRFTRVLRYRVRRDPSVQKMIADAASLDTPKVTQAPQRATEPVV